jgi:hypothetical protein
MPFIGQQPITGAYSKLDAITTSATATYNLLLGGSAYSPASANHLLVSLNGVMQAPQDSFTVSGSTITFASALTSSDSIDFIMALGDVLNIGTPSDGTVSTAKIASGAVTDAKIAAMAASKLTGALPAIDGSALTNVVPAPSANSIVQSIYSPFGAARKSFSNSGAFVSSGHSVSITPQYSNSMIELELHVVTNTGSNNVQIAFHETTSSATDLGSKTYTGDHAGWRTVSQMLQVASTGTTARTFEPYVKSASAIYGIQTTTTTAPGHSGAVLIAREISQ